MVVLELHGHAALAHLLELAALLPGVRPRPIIERVANGVVGDRLPVIRRQLVLPVAVRVRIGNGVYRRAGRAGGVGVIRLGGDVAAAVVVVHPGGAGRARRRIVRVVHADELAEGVVGIRRHFAIARLRGDVPARIVGVGKVHSLPCRESAWPRPPSSRG